VADEKGYMEVQGHSRWDCSALALGKFMGSGPEQTIRLRDLVRLNSLKFCCSCLQVMFLIGSILGLILFKTFIDALDDGTDCALKHDDTQLGGANDMLEDRPTIQRDLDRVGSGLAGTAESSTKSNSKSCSLEPNHPRKQDKLGLTDYKAALQKKRWESWCTSCAVARPHLDTVLSIGLPSTGPTSMYWIKSSRCLWDGQGWSTQCGRRGGGSWASSAWEGEAPGACNYLTGEYRGNRSGLFLDIHRERNRKREKTIGTLCKQGNSC